MRRISFVIMMTASMLSIAAAGEPGSHAVWPSRDYLEAMAEQLRCPDDGECMDVARAMGEIGSPTIPRLVSSLKDKDLDVRRMATMALCFMCTTKSTPKSAIPALLEAAGDPDPGISAIAASALTEIRQAAVPALVQALADETLSPASRLMIVEILGSIGPAAEKAIPDLSLLAENDPAELVRKSAQDALKKVALDEKSRQQQIKVLLDQVKLGTQNDRTKAAVQLAEMGPAAEAAIPTLVAFLNDKDASLSVRAQHALTLIGSPAEPALIRFVKEGNIRNPRVLFVLAGIGTPAVPALVEALNSDNVRLRLAAVDGLASLGPEAAAGVPELARLAQHAQDETLRTAAKAALTTIQVLQTDVPTGATASNLIERLKSSSGIRRAKVISALGTLGSPAKDAVPVLIEAMKDEDYLGRFSAAWALAHIGVAAQPALIETLSDKSYRVRALAAYALGCMASDAAPAVPALIKALKDDRAQVRYQAAGALGRLGPDAKSAVPALADARQDIDDRVARAAQDALSKVAALSERSPISSKKPRKEYAPAQATTQPRTTIAADQENTARDRLGVTQGPKLTSEQEKMFLASMRLVHEAGDLAKAGDYDRAINNLRTALSLQGKLPQSEKLQGDCRNMIALLEKLKTTPVTKHTDKFNEQIDQGEAFLRAKKPEQALPCFRTCLELLRDVPDSSELQASVRTWLACALSDAGRSEEAIKECEKAQEILADRKTDIAAGAFRRMGVILADCGRKREGIESGKRALAIWADLPGTEMDRAGCHLNISYTLTDMGQFSEAMDQQNKAMTLLNKVGPSAGRSRYLELAGICYKARGNTLGKSGSHELAMTDLKEAERFFSAQPGMESEKAACLIDVASSLMELGRFEEAIAQHGKAAAIFAALPGAKAEEASCQMNIAGVLNRLGQSEAALALQLHALETVAKMPHASPIIAALHLGIGNSLTRLGRYGESAEYTSKAIELLEKQPGSKKETHASRVNLARILMALGRYGEAIEQVRAAMKGLTELVDGSEEAQGLCRAVAAEAYLSQQKFSEAASELEAAGKRNAKYQELGELQAQVQEGQGRLWIALEERIEFIDLLESRRTLIQASEYKMSWFEDFTVVHKRMASLLLRMGREKVEITAPRALKWGVTPEEIAFHYADQGKGRSLEDALREKSALKAARPDTKFLAEDRELSLRISKLTSLREPLPETDTERRKKLTEEIDSLQQRRNVIEVELKNTTLGGYVAPDFRKPMEMAKELEPDRAVLQYSVGEKVGWLLILTREGVTAHKLGAETPALPELLARQEATLSQLAEAWNKRPDKVGLDGLVRLARARAEDLGKREDERQNLVGPEQEKAILVRLADVALPDSALGELRKRGIHRLLVIPDGSLHYVPFAMLRLKNEKDAGTHYLVEEFASSYIPAMTTLDTIRKQKKEREAKRAIERRPLLAFANPAYGAENLPSAPPTAAAKDDMLTRLRSFRTDSYKNAGLRLTSLPETEKEAVRVASLFAPPKTYTTFTTGEPEGQSVIFAGRGACEEEIKQLLAVSDRPTARRQWQYVLFSTHGLADTFNGMLSCLALSSPAADSEEDGFLQAQEVMNLELDADLVMLSACQTGLGRLRGGEGLVGLSAAFFYAGVESVCASLWQVPSGPTSQLVPEFFKRLKEGKVDRAEALRQAQLQVLRQGQGSDGKPADYSTPFCWAAFILVGEHR